MLDAIAKNMLVPLLLRLGLAVIFIYHGYGMIQHNWGATWAQKMSEPPPAPAQVAVAWGQLVGGIALALGLLTRLAALGIAVIMGGAIAVVHWPHGFDLQQGGYEYNFAILVMCFALILVGGGSLALDRLLWRRRRVIEHDRRPAGA